MTDDKAAEKRKADIREANRKISRPETDTPKHGRVFVGRREELAINPTGDGYDAPDDLSDTEKALRRAAGTSKPKR